MKFAWTLVPDVGEPSQEVYAMLEHADRIMRDCLITTFTIKAHGLRLRYEAGEDCVPTALHRYWEEPCNR